MTKSEKLSAEVLGLTEFNAEIFGKQIEKIDICNDCVVKFHFADGHEETKTLADAVTLRELDC